MDTDNETPISKNNDPAPKGLVRRAGYVVRATAWAALLGILETLGSERGRRLLAVLVLVGGVIGCAVIRPVRIIEAGEAAVRVNHLSGRFTEMREGWAFVLPGVHELHRYTLRDQIYRPTDSAHVYGDAPFQSLEGLSIGVDVTVRYALDPDRLSVAARRLPDDISTQLVRPVVDGILRRTLASHNVREIFATQRDVIQKAVTDELQAALSSDGVLIKAVVIGNVDLPKQYKDGVELLLAEELAAQKMKYTLELKEQQVEGTKLDAEGDKARRIKAAEAQGLEEIIEAKSKAEAMQHILPFKEKEIEQRRLEAEASKVQRIKQAEGEAEARRIEGGGEASYRRTIADSDAYRTEVTGKASAEQLERESKLIAKNPLLIQKTLADKLSDKIQVIVAPPQAGGFFAGGLIGMRQSNTNSNAIASGSSAANSQAAGNSEDGDEH